MTTPQNFGTDPELDPTDMIEVAHQSYHLECAISHYKASRNLFEARLAVILRERQLPAYVAERVRFHLDAIILAWEHGNVQRALKLHDQLKGLAESLTGSLASLYDLMAAVARHR